ncbi:MAG: FAD-dependent monooxygenase [Pseudomonadota bacterium]
MTRKAVVVGAGIGGLTAAIALEHRGWSVTVLERAAALTDVGAGIQISPNGTKILDALGCLAELESVAFEPPAIEMRLGTSGRRIFRMPMAEAARDRWGGPHLNVHRADLVDVLRRTIKGQIELGQTVTATTGPGGVVLADGSTRSADLVVAADGLQSVIREQMIGPQTPHFTGNIAWRCTVPRDRVPDCPVATTIWAGPGRHAITNWLRGGAVLNFVGIVETQDTGAERWDRIGQAADALADFDGWVPAVRAPLAAADQVMRWPVYDRAPTRNWVQGRTVLLGDAAHPMVPSMAQGAVQAIEDAWVLAALMARDIDAGLQRYQTLRQPRTARVQMTSLKNLRQFHRQGTLAQMVTYGPMAVASQVAPSLLYQRPDWIYAATPDSLIE